MKKDFAEKLKELRSKHLLNDPEIQLAIEVLKRKGVTLQDIEKAYHFLNEQYFQDGRPLSRKQIDQVLDVMCKEIQIQVDA